MQKAISGYHLLMLLTIIDDKLNATEDAVVVDWLAKSYNTKLPLDEAMTILAGLKKEDFKPHFLKHMDLFYAHSNEKERVEFLQFAMNIIKADGMIDQRENEYFDILFEAWNEGE